MLKWLKVRWLALRLRSRDDLVRYHAARTLAQDGDLRAVEVLVRFVNRADIGVAAIEALVQLGDRRAIDPFIRALGNECADRSARIAAADALVTMAPDLALAPLVEALGDKDHLLRWKATEALLRLGNARAVDALINSSKDEDSGVRRGVVNALGAFVEPKSVGCLISLLGDGSREVRKAAAASLERLGEMRWKSLINGDDDDFQHLAACGDPRAVKSLITGLKYLNTFDSAVEAVKQLGDRGAVPTLIEALSYKSDYCRAKAARVLGKLGDSSALDPLLQRFKDDSSAMVRRAIAEGLGDLGDARSIASLRLGLCSSDGDIQRAASAALTKLRAVDALLELIDFKNKSATWSAGRFAAEALGNVGDLRAVEPLIKALDHEEWGAPAAEALGKLKDRRAFGPLVEVLSHQSEQHRRAAVKALGSLGDPRAYDLLLNALLQGRSDSRLHQIRKTAALALAELRDPRAIEPLVKVLAEPDFSLRSSVAWALTKILTGPNPLKVDPACWTHIHDLIHEPLPTGGPDLDDIEMSKVGVDFPSAPPNATDIKPA